MLLAQCAVCQECFSNSLDCLMSALSCGHVFHKHCVDTWFKTSPTCPQCRILVTRNSIIHRLFFDTVVNGVNQTIGQATKSSSKESLNIEVHRLNSEVVRLEEALTSRDQKLEEMSKALESRNKEISSLTILYQETDKLYEQERRCSRDLKMEISSFKKFLKEAELMKNEAVKLRQEADEMYNVKKLLSSTEDAARDLFSRYSGSDDCESNKDLHSLCKWASILRSELTSTREKVRSYRNELSRVRRQQVSASQRVARAETIAQEQKERVENLESELSHLLNRLNSDPQGTKKHLDKLPKSNISLLSDSICSSSIVSVDNHTDVSSVVTPVSKPLKAMTTPDLLILSPWEQSPCSNLQSKLCTPSGNPFQCEDAKQSNRRDSTVTGKYNHSLLFTPSKGKEGSHQRRPSSIYQMAIMRQHSKISGSYAFPISPSRHKHVDRSHLSKSSSAVAPKLSESVNRSLKRSSASSTTILKKSDPNTHKSAKLDKFVVKF